MKAREIWMPEGSYLVLHEKPNTQQEQIAKEVGGYIHWREVVTIDWEKVWREFTGHDLTDFEFMHKIQELVEKQLRGEE